VILGLLGCLSIDFRQHAFEYYVLCLFALLGLCFLASSVDLISIFLSIELQTLAFYILATYKPKSVFSLEAGFKYFFAGAFASAIILLGISLIYAELGTTNFFIFPSYIDPQALGATYQSLYQQASDSSITLVSIVNAPGLKLTSGFFLFTIGLLFKLGCFPFHKWVADVYEGAPTHVTTIFAVLPKLPVFVVLFRLASGLQDSSWLFFLELAAIGSICLGTFYSCGQLKAKRLLAYSGIAHTGYALLVVSSGAYHGTAVSIFYLVVYIITSLFLWGIVQTYPRFDQASIHVSDLASWYSVHPSFSTISGLVLFSLAGIPPFAGFWAKLNLFYSLAGQGSYLLVIFGGVISAISFMYYLAFVVFLITEKGRPGQIPSILTNTHSGILVLSAWILFLSYFWNYFLGDICISMAFSLIS
jgi:NADH-quinone oxidoreductase subunit N